MNPYEELPLKCFWKTAVSEKSMFDISDIYESKFDIQPDDKISTYGSCFAQYFGKALRFRGYDWLVTELPPTGLSENSCNLFNYNIFSSRTGNIYTASLLMQWVRWALGIDNIPDEYWCRGKRFYDPFRPNIEPHGFCSLPELLKSRDETICAFKKSIQDSDYLVFTMGLTERWVNTSLSYEYPMCPGTLCGDFDKDAHCFNNLKFEEVRSSMVETMRLMRSCNPSLKFILTVSPVPLTATNTNQNVLVASMESKSILRAVAGQLARNNDFVDYFPSYEIINSPVFKGVFFEPNLRTINPYGVSFVMDHFFSGLSTRLSDGESKNEWSDFPSAYHDVCDEEILASFADIKK